MAGRILDEVIEAVRAQVRLEDIVSNYVQLKNAGGGRLIGLCPFHQEKTPSFQVDTQKQFYYCFGCGQGGDAIKLLRELENLSFTEAVVQLAGITGIEVRYDEKGGGKSLPAGLRNRILAANQEALKFYQAQLNTAEAQIARDFIIGRKFTQQDALRFSLGYAPNSGKALLRHLTAQGFTKEELVKAGLVRESGWDFFQGRILWPIKDSGRSVLGFGARRLYEDDRMPAKYLNTPETPVYRKSQVLYGLDLARKPIGMKNQVVIVEGYTDVMAAHIAGVDTAVASCGTAFGAEHARILVRIMGSSNTGEVIFAFDGDSAGQKAALKAYQEEEHFLCPTYVAIEPSGMDPCDLRIAKGDVAVRDLIGKREELYRYVMRHTVAQYDLDSVAGRLDAVRAALPFIASVRDSARREGFFREVATLTGEDISIVTREFRRMVPRKKPDPRKHRSYSPNIGQTLTASQKSQVGVAQLGSRQSLAQQAPASQVESSELALISALPKPNPKDPRVANERGLLQLILQNPECFADSWYGVLATDFRHPTYRALFELVQRTPIAKSATEWNQKLLSGNTDSVLANLIIELTISKLLRPASSSYAQAYAASVRIPKVEEKISNLRAKISRGAMVDNSKEFTEYLAELLSLDNQLKALKAQALQQ